MPYELTDFLISLADRAQLDQFNADPEQTMAKAGLSDAQKAAIRTQNRAKIRQLAKMELTDSGQGDSVSSSSKVLADGDEPEVGPTDVNDVGPQVDHNIVQNVDLSEDVVDRYGYAFYSDLFEEVPASANGRGELIVVGGGIKAANHMTNETRSIVETANKVLYCVADSAVERWLLKVQPSAENLYAFYSDDKPRRKTYEQMVERILECLHIYHRVCVMFYGHPGVFVWPSYRSIRQARQEGYRAIMFPAVSALDCLFADIGIDPSRFGCQIFEATDILIRRRKIDTGAAVIVWQIACVGDFGFKSTGYDGRNIGVLTEYLEGFYGGNHQAILYEASQYPVCEPRITKTTISELANSTITGITTLYIPPKDKLTFDKSMIDRLGLAAHFGD